MATSAFKEPVDIVNRALDHCGAPSIVTLEDDDKGAQLGARVYDKLRRAELRRRVWRFATRRATLYPIETPLAETTSPPTGFGVAQSLPTLLLIPETFSLTTSYPTGSIVIDADGDIWQSTVNFNIGNVPGAPGVLVWDTYFGSMNVAPFNTSLDTQPTTQASPSSYYAGDLVYEQDGAGQNQVYVSLQGLNSNDPSTATAWSATATYNMGQTVVDAQGWFWNSVIDLNTNNQPGFYTTWSSVPTYAIGAIVIGSDTLLYQAILATNNVNPAGNSFPLSWLQLGTKPGAYPIWNSTTTYTKNQVIAAIDGNLYQSLQNANEGNQPIGSTFNPNTPATNFWMATGKKNAWTSAFVGSTSNLAWQAINATLTDLNIVYPIGSGPATQTFTRNVFQLPNGYLRKAPQDPKAGSTNYLGFPSGRIYDDWEFEGNYIVSRQPYPIVLRFVADVTQVSTFDDMFCEGLGARIGIEIVEALTQAAGKKAGIEQDYKHFMEEAGVVNGIETGATEPAIDDWIACRV